MRYIIVMNGWTPAPWRICAPTVFALLAVALGTLSCHSNAPVREAALAEGVLTADQAKNHIGQSATVCGVVASTGYVGGGKTFVNLDKPWPSQLFTILIWGEDLSTFSPKPATGKASGSASLE
jgi:hypothetical protein